MVKTSTTRYNVADHLRTSEEVVAYIDACINEPGVDISFVIKAINDAMQASGMSRENLELLCPPVKLYK